MHELVEDGVTGFLVDTEDEMLAAIREVGKLDRQRCASALARFSVESMVSAHGRLYGKFWQASVPEEPPEWSESGFAGLARTGRAKSCSPPCASISLRAGGAALSATALAPAIGAAERGLLPCLMPWWRSGCW
jgi:hypothetical protein